MSRAEWMTVTEYLLSAMLLLIGDGVLLNDLRMIEIILDED